VTPTLDTVFFDLDDTLYMDQGCAAMVFAEVCAEAHRRCGCDSVALESAVRRHARARWYALRDRYGAIDRMGCSSWASLWIPFPEGDDPEWTALRAHADEHRAGAWRAGLAEVGGDEARAPELALLFEAAHRRTHAAFPDVEGVLERLAPHVRLGLVTNGPVAGQRIKLAGIGLAGRLDPQVISEQVGLAKPAPEVFAEALRRAGTTPERAAMVGDNPWHDAMGARAAGMLGVWLNRFGHETPAEWDGPTIVGLAELPGVLGVG
jgi:putative hydrolase of the HAD superfamily